MMVEQFSFNISLSILNHLGRNLYRSFATVLGEAISNSWDAEANNVSIYIDRENNSFFIKDDGVGMTSDDFQNKFLKIGYSKRKDGKTESPEKKRRYIGRKGIGKLALLSCADKIHIITKVKDGDYVGGIIDNSGLDDAINDDLTPEMYPLGELDLKRFEQHTKDHEKGTIIYFENIKEGVKNSLDFLKKIIALYFRFSLLDDSFNIFLNDEKITQKHLEDLTKNTEFVWIINHIDDPLIKEFVNLKEPEKNITLRGEIKGFIASVVKPRDLKITTTEERVGINLFVNGRIREKDILKHIPTARLAENYLYGQIHFDDLDDELDRFTSAREGIVANDEKYKAFLEDLRKKILEIVSNWDALRIKHREDGDSENEDIPKKERKSRELYNAVSEEYVPRRKTDEEKEKIEAWVDELAEDAHFNFSAYADCFTSENLIRRYVRENGIKLTKEAKEEIAIFKTKEDTNKQKGNISIDVRDASDNLSYLSMDGLANLVDKPDRSKPNTQALARDAAEYKPMRDAVAHTSQLTHTAKQRLNSVYENIKGRIRELLKNKN